jgi:glycosyltransferase involved in cell wall biosynthesis
LLHWGSSPLLAIACLFIRLIPKSFDIGIGPLPMINNIYWARALRKKGYLVETFVNKTYYITSEFDVLLKNGWNIIFYYCPALSFLRAAARYRCVYIYFNGGPLQQIPFLRLIEPALFRLANVRTVVMPYGSDCQLLERTQNKTAVNAMCADYPHFFRRNQSAVRRQVNIWCREADIVIGAMDSIDYLPFWNRIRHCHFAIDTNAITPVYPKAPAGVSLKILHAPNHKMMKGSSFVFAAIDKLKAEGYDIELIFKQNVPNNEFLSIISEADIVVDQLILGWYAMFAMEAMSFGKPVICYLRPDLLKTFENTGCIAPNEIPLISAQPAELADVLRSLLLKPDSLYDIGRRSRRYVEKYHSLNAVGEFYDEINKSLKVYPKGQSDYA